MDATRLSAHQQAKLRRLSAPEVLSSDDEAGEINIVPFLDMVVNIMMFVLATVAVTFVSTTDATLPPFKGVRESQRELNLAVMLTNDGIAVKTAQGNVATGCEGYGPGLTIAARGRDRGGEPVYDFEALTACVSKLKSLSPSFQNEAQVRIAASSNISYRSVVDCIDHVRAGPSGEALFPEVLFAMPR
jgi:biopolymer transport protein TolR